MTAEQQFRQVDIAIAWGLAREDVEIVDESDRWIEEWGRANDFRVRCFDAGWCRGLHGCLRETGGRLSADVLALMR
jgi:hypothetical protein